MDKKLSDWIGLTIMMILLTILGLIRDNYGNTKIFLGLEPIVTTIVFLGLIFIHLKDIKRKTEEKKKRPIQGLVLDYIAIILSIIYLILRWGRYIIK